MKTSNRPIKLLAYSLCLVAGLYNCKPKEVDSLKPIPIDTKALDNVKLPDLKPTTPTPVVAVAAKVDASAQATAVNNGMKNIAATGVVPAAVEKAAADVAKAITDEKAAALADGFTADVLTVLNETGELPAGLKAEVTALAANPALVSYWPTFTLPSVNGKAVNARVGAKSPELVEPRMMEAVTADNVDACKKTAADALNKAIEVLKQTRAAQIALVTATFSTAEAAAKAATPVCQKGVEDKYKALIQAASKELETDLEALKAAQKTLGPSYGRLRSLRLTAHNQLVSGLKNLQKAEVNVCKSVQEATITAAALARDQDLNVINTNFNTASEAAVKTYEQIIKSCHNQGSGS